MKSSAVITRFPPSPTGNLHIGGVRTALFNYLFAKHNGGKIFLRFEDTDKERSRPEFEEDIIKGLAWLGLELEQSAFLRQSERTEVYKKHLVALIEKGSAYEAEESTNNPGKKVIRFKNPNTAVVFNDLIRGEVRFDTTELGDFVLARSAEEPLYHLAVVVDDAETGVTHVIRGEEHISNTQRQILILEALGFSRPQYAHIPLILASDKSKLSKRHGAVSVNEYRAQGFIPEALINYLALLGWNPGGEKELYSLDELVKEFSLERVHKSGAVFDIEKLKWFNHEHLKKLSDEEFEARFEAYITSRGGLIPSYFHKIIPLLRERSRTFDEAYQSLHGEFYGIMELPDDIVPDSNLLLQGAKSDAGAVKKHLEKVSELIQELSEDFTVTQVKDAVFPYATEEGRASVLWPLRVALSGKEKSPDPFTLAALLGKEKTLNRLEKALETLS